jgi:hypothetical protein
MLMMKRNETVETLSWYICLQRQRKTTQNLSQGCRPAAHEINLGPPKHEAGADLGQELNVTPFCKSGLVYAKLHGSAAFL